MGDTTLAQDYIDAANALVLAFGETQSMRLETGGVLDPNNASAGKTGKTVTDYPDVDVAFYDSVDDFFNSENIETGDRVAVVVCESVPVKITTAMRLIDGDTIYKIVAVETQDIAGIEIVSFLQVRE